MSVTAQTVMFPTDSAVSMDGVTKVFIQWQKDTARDGIRRKPLKPEKHVVTALDQVSLHIRRGEFVAYAGPNGAGKSTTMKLLSGMLLPTSGHISVLNLSPEKRRRALMKQIGVLFGNRTELWWDHPIAQSFEWKRVVWDIPRDVYLRNLNMAVEMLDLGGLLKTFARELSLGQRMRADLAMLLLHDPVLILLDEPTLGLDVVAKRQMIDFLKKLNRESGATIIVSSHDMDDLEEMARRIVMVSKGRIAYDGGFEGLRGIAGNLTRITVTMTGNHIPAMDGGTLIYAENGVFEYEADVVKHPIQGLIRQLSETEGVKDVEIRKAPIEQVIAGLYAAWK